MTDSTQNQNIKIQVLELMSKQLNTLESYFNNKLPIEFDKLGKLLHMQLDLANSICANTDKPKITDLDVMDSIANRSLENDIDVSEPYENDEYEEKSPYKKK
jgi:hypothetical protein